MSDSPFVCKYGPHKGDYTVHLRVNGDRVAEVRNIGRPLRGDPVMWIGWYTDLEGKRTERIVTEYDRTRFTSRAQLLATIERRLKERGVLW